MHTTMLRNRPHLELKTEQKRLAECMGSSGKYHDRRLKSPGPAWRFGWRAAVKSAAAGQAEHTFGVNNTHTHTTPGTTGRIEPYMQRSAWFAGARTGARCVVKTATPASHESPFPRTLPHGAALHGLRQKKPGVACFKILFSRAVSVLPTDNASQSHRPEDAALHPHP